MGKSYDGQKVTPADIQNVKLRDALQLFFNKAYKIGQYEVVEMQEKKEGKKKV